MKSTLKSGLRKFLYYLGGDQPAVAWVERLRSVCGAYIGLMLVLAMAKYLGEISGLDEWVVVLVGQVRFWCLFCHRVLWLSPGL